MMALETEAIIFRFIIDLFKNPPLILGRHIFEILISLSLKRFPLFFFERGGG